MNKTEARTVAGTPFEIVEQRPDEIAANVAPCRHGLVHRTHVAVEIGDPAVILDPAVQVRGFLVAGAVLQLFDINNNVVFSIPLTAEREQTFMR